MQARRLKTPSKTNRTHAAPLDQKSPGTARVFCGLRIDCPHLTLALTTFKRLALDPGSKSPPAGCRRCVPHLRHHRRRLRHGLVAHRHSGDGPGGVGRGRPGPLRGRADRSGEVRSRDGHAATTRVAERHVLCDFRRRLGVALRATHRLGPALFPLGDCGGARLVVRGVAGVGKDDVKQVVVPDHKPALYS